MGGNEDEEDGTEEGDGDDGVRRQSSMLDRCRCSSDLESIAAAMWLTSVWEGLITRRPPSSMIL